MKTIGVLGGLGPQATMDFEARVHQASQKVIPRQANSGYPPMVVYYCRFPPVLMDGDHMVMPPRPDPRLLEAARALGSVADFLAIPANGPHEFTDQIEQASGREVLSLVDLALEQLAQEGWQKVGLLALGEPRVYMRPLQARGIEYIILPKALRARLDQAIFSVMEGRDGVEERQVAGKALGYLRAQGVDGIILGCTELPLLMDGEAELELINPSQLLAQASVAYAMR